MPTTFVVQVNRSAITRQFLPGGQGYRWMDRVRLAMHQACIQEASTFTRSGEILRGHRSYARGYGGNRVDVRISNSAEHAAWKHNGTRAVITPLTANYLLVPIAPGSHHRVRRGSVAGQTADPWMSRGCARVARSRGAIEVF